MKTIFQNEAELIKVVAESKSQYESQRHRLSYEEKLKILVKLQEKAYFMGKIKIKPWPIH